MDERIESRGIETEKKSLIELAVKRVKPSDLRTQGFGRTKTWLFGLAVEKIP